MAKIDYVYKSKILNTDLCKKIGKIDAKTYLNSLDGIVHDSELDNQYFDLLMQYKYDDIQEARKINKASYNRFKRLKDRILDFISKGRCIFATLTFRDDVFSNTNFATRRKYVSRYLKSISDYYIANVDFGSETEREHYHAIILKDFITDKWEYGFTWFEIIRTNKFASKNLSNYVSKLTNHSIKETTKRYALIYSRQVKSI